MEIKIKVFRNETPIAGNNLIIAQKVCVEWHIRYKLIQTNHPPTPTHSPNLKKTHLISWKKPLQGFIKINFNESKTTRGETEGYIIRNWEGRFIQATAFNLGAVLVAEATAMQNGLQATVQASFTNIHIECNNKILIAIQGHIQPPWKIHVVLYDITAYLQLCNPISTTHIFGEGNHSDDLVAKYALSIDPTVVWNEVPQRNLFCIINEDNSGRIIDRWFA